MIFSVDNSNYFSKDDLLGKIRDWFWEKAVKFILSSDFLRWFPMKWIFFVDWKCGPCLNEFFDHKQRSLIA